MRSTANPETPAVRVVSTGKRTGWRKHRGSRQPVTFEAALFDGRLIITDKDSFLNALRQGIGSGKAYGFGLLSIAP